MYSDTITLFNYHKATRKWYPSVISGVDSGLNQASKLLVNGVANTDGVHILIHCSQNKSVLTLTGRKFYIPPKEYANCPHPETTITFSPECDFIYGGRWSDLNLRFKYGQQKYGGLFYGGKSITLTPVEESDDNDGFYNELNDEYDHVYLIDSVAFYGLLPHFEIGGK